MSFSVSIPATDKNEFAAVVQAAIPSPPLTSDAGIALFKALQDAAIAIGSQYDGDFPITAGLSGHVCEEEGVGTYDSASLSVYETALPVPTPRG